jgi:hypothetical protein
VVSGADVVDWEKSAPPGKRAANNRALRTMAREPLF